MTLKWGQKLGFVPKKYPKLANVIEKYCGTVDQDDLGVGCSLHGQVIRDPAIFVLELSQIQCSTAPNFARHQEPIL